MKKYVLLGSAFSLAMGFIYFVLLDEPGAYFYVFAGLAFLGGPLGAGVAAAARTTERKLRVFFAVGGSVFGIWRQLMTELCICLTINWGCSLTRTGEFRENMLLIDNYGGLSESDRPFLMRTSDGHWYVETSAIISSWGADGSVRSRPQMYLNAVARGCFVDGKTREVTKLSDN